MRRRIRGRLRRHEGEADAPPEEEYFEIDPRELSGVFAAPGWLRDVGFTAWLLVGVAVFLVGAVWLMALTQIIVLPVITAAVVGAVASPLVGKMHDRGLPRAAGAVIVMLGLILVGIGMFVMILAGITNELSSITSQLGDAKDEIAGWLQDIGVDPHTATNAKDEASRSVNDAGSALLTGLGEGIRALSGIAFFMAMAALSLFFLLKDGPTIRQWGERHLGVPLDVAKVVSQRTLGALRGYFLGVTIVAGFSAVVVSIGSVILGVPLVGTIAAVTFIGGYIPYIGAWSAATFSVLLALGGSGPEAALGMVVVQFLANGVLQQAVQPFAMGAALGIHPLGGARGHDRRRRPVRDDRPGPGSPPRFSRCANLRRPRPRERRQPGTGGRRAPARGGEERWRRSLRTARSARGAPSRSS